mmetsp:Transcript_40528/g.47138  ORF Transcript_40528/g.47138 Transcript_40528/m.47138 type:complete len:461 (+) Transcript_40528:34-1416(+)
MKMKPIFILSVLLVSVFAIQEPTGVILLFRHGARGPIDDSFEKTWENMYGELTGVGMRQQYLRGAYLAQLYPQLFSQYNSNNYYIRSTDYNRTLMSVYSLLDGLLYEKGPTFIDNYPFERAYPPYTANFLDKNMDVFPHKYQAVPIHTVETSSDELLLGNDPKVCPIAAKLISNQTEEPTYKEVVAKFKQTISEVSKRMNSTTVLSIDQLEDLEDTIIANYFEQKQLPGDIDPNSELGKNLTFLIMYKTYFLEIGSTLQRQLSSMNLMNQFKADLQSILQSSDPSVKLYSAHDSTLAPILAVTGIATHDCLYKNFFENGTYTSCYYPKFASQIRIEAWKNDTDLNSSEIRFYFDEAPQNLCNSETGHCTWKDFQSLIDTYTQGKDINYFRSMCASESQSSPSNNTTNGTDSVAEIPDGPDIGLKYAIYALTAFAGVLFVGIIYCIGKKIDRESETEAQLI